MNNELCLTLDTTPDQERRLRALQVAFADVCNALAPLVQQTRCWNRVTLHHLAYKDLRQRFPNVGSQMICNAIYSVSRTGRMVFQSPSSPFHFARLQVQGKPLPLLRFSDHSPVYFDRHTLSIAGEQLSVYTLDGRLRLRAPLPALAGAGFGKLRLREAVLSRHPGTGRFQFSFWLGEETRQRVVRTPSAVVADVVPEYVQVQAVA